MTPRYSPEELAAQEAALVDEYVNVHGYSLEDAILAAAREIAEGRRSTMRSFYPSKTRNSRTPGAARHGPRQRRKDAHRYSW